METALNRLKSGDTGKAVDTVDTWTESAAGSRTPDTTDQIFSLCASLHITLSISGDGGFTAGPSALLTPAIREGLAAHKPAIMARLLLERVAASIAAGTDVCAVCGGPGTSSMLDGTWLCDPHAEAHWARLFPIATPDVQVATLAAVHAAHAATAVAEGRLFG